MAFNNYVYFNGILLPFPDSFSLDIFDIEADSSGESEAGTIQRDIVREGVYEISLSFTLSAKWLKKMTDFKGRPKLVVKFFDPLSLLEKELNMYIEAYSVKLLKDTSRKSLWQVSFKLKEF